MRVLRRALWPIARPVFKLAVRAFDADPWERFEHAVPLSLFGSGATRDFRWYFEGESSVPTRSLDDVCNWLLGCEYVRDQEQFGVVDYWQHPREFEERRRGDCEDHALWAWRKLTELGVYAELVRGRLRGADDQWGSHVWVQFRDGESEFLLDAVAASASVMIRPVSDPRIREEYTPHFAVTAAFRSFAYWGYVRDLF